MQKIPTKFPDVWLVQPDVFEDERGFFLESYSQIKMEKLGFNYTFLQDNHSKSIKNTVRGLHFQLPPGQVKLVRCTKGKIWDIVVDIRPKSPHFRKWMGIELTENNYTQILIPVGYAHGFAVLSDFAEIEYKVTNYYDPTIERGIQWNDKSIEVDWKVENPILSKRDMNNPSLSQYLKIK
ncbi:dTDP-4-dehydrorhamnose 3,5-epimerase [Candidatus Lokiarchaeum ossiferum]|uniref:dTDP-4-dehydrorhamnose 3,5-epimerase n=1 Tax=Candidatus Lokiarchaeum ossiferum TaxID=2951803 RepID=UPI00352E2C04